jgi:hypothetical protein
MIGLMANIIVEPSEAWPVVAAGLGSAVIVSLFNLVVARKQRHADSGRLDKQLAHDRKMREQQQEIDAARFEQQLAHDRETRQQQSDAESKRLDRQLAQDRELREQELAHDREMRDLALMRETLAPIIARTLDWDAFNKLHLRLKVDGTQPIDDATWASEIVPLVSEVADVSESLRRGSRTLVILAGPEAPIALKLKEVANDGDTLVHLATRRAKEGRTTPEIQASLDGLLPQYGFDHARFVEAANEAVRWGRGQRLVGRP